MEEDSSLHTHVRHTHHPPPHTETHGHIRTKKQTNKHNPTCFTGCEQTCKVHIPFTCFTLRRAYFKVASVLAFPLAFLSAGRWTFSSLSVLISSLCASALADCSLLWNSRKKAIECESFGESGWGRDSHILHPGLPHLGPATPSQLWPGMRSRDMAKHLLPGDHRLIRIPVLAQREESFQQDPCPGVRLGLV